MWDRHRPQPDNTQHSQDTDIILLAGLEPAIPSRERPQTYGFDGEATGTGAFFDIQHNVILSSLRKYSLTNVLYNVVHIYYGSYVTGWGRGE